MRCHQPEPRDRPQSHTQSRGKAKMAAQLQARVQACKILGDQDEQNESSPSPVDTNSQPLRRIQDFRLAQAPAQKRSLCSMQMKVYSPPSFCISMLNLMCTTAAPFSIWSPQTSAFQDDKSLNHFCSATQQTHL